MDINNRQDIEKLTSFFYDRVRKDELLGPIFNDIMKVNWDHHIPIINDFWETLLFGTGNYTRNAMGVHFEINKKVKLEATHFERWLNLFFKTADELFNGSNTEVIKNKAKSIAGLMLFNMNKENDGLTVNPLPA